MSPKPEDPTGPSAGNPFDPEKTPKRYRAYNEGKRAARSRKLISSCPYNAGSRTAMAWLEGYAVMKNRG